MNHNDFSLDVVSLDTTEEGKNILKVPEWSVKLLSGLLDDPSSHDVTFKTSDGGSVSAHRLIIAAASPVFHAMLYGNMKESNEKEIELPSVDANCLQNLLTFVYTGQVETTLAENQSLLLAARYFNITTLETKCIDTIVGSLTDLNWCKLTAFAKQQQFDALLEQCYVYMQNNLDKIVNTLDFKCLPAECMVEICSNSEVCIKELDLFFAINEWSDYQKDTLPEDIIKSVSQLIRYPLIHASDLVEKVGPSHHTDQYLYRTALEYHVWPNSFSGPQDQIKIRKYYFDFRTNSKGLSIEHNPEGTFITNESEPEACKCIAKIHLTESSPVQFKLCLRSRGDIRLLAGFRLTKVACLSVHNFPLHKELDGCITLKGNHLQIKVGNESASIAFKDSEMANTFGVYIKNKGSQVKIIRM